MAGAQLLTEAEAAQVLNTSVRHLAYLRSKKAGPPFVKLGRMIRYNPGALVRWVNAGGDRQAELDRSRSRPVIAS